MAWFPSISTTNGLMSRRVGSEGMTPGDPRPLGTFDANGSALRGLNPSTGSSRPRPLGQHLTSRFRAVPVLAQ
jgi:hypothetical protein